MPATVGPGGSSASTGAEGSTRDAEPDVQVRAIDGADDAATVRAAGDGSEARPPIGRTLLRVALGLQIALGVLWGVSMLFFAAQIALGDPSGPHIEKIALEGGAHFALVFGAILVWRRPRESRTLLLVMVFLNTLWAITDAIYIPTFHLTAFDFTAKLVVNASLAVLLAVSGYRARLIP
jgi:hypothetical protein